MPPVSFAIWLVAGLLLVLIHWTAVAYSNALRTYSRSRLEDLCQARGHAARAEEVFRHDTKSETASGLVAFGSGLVLALVFGVLVARGRHSWSFDFVMALLVFVFGAGHIASSIYGKVLAEDLLDRGWPVATGLRRLMSPISFVIGSAESMVEKRVHGRQWSRIGPRPASVEVEIHARSEEEATNLDAELPASARAMLENAVALLDLDAVSLMTPRSSMVALPASTSVREAARRFAISGLSRIPVYGEHRDDIVGVLYVKDLLALLLDASVESERSIRKVARPPYLVPETKNAAELLDELRQRQVQLAIVVDEYGSVAGLVTLEDLLEQIVGPIDDEHDVPSLRETVIDLGGGIYEVDGLIDVEDLNDRLDLELPTDGDYQTVGGLAFHALGRVPEPGATFQAGGIHFTVLKVGDHAVQRLQLARHTAPDVPGRPHS